MTHQRKFVATDSPCALLRRHASFCRIHLLLHRCFSLCTNRICDPSAFSADLWTCSQCPSLWGCSENSRLMLILTFAKIAYCFPAIISKYHLPRQPTSWSSRSRRIAAVWSSWSWSQCERRVWPALCVRSVQGTLSCCQHKSDTAMFGPRRPDEGPSARPTSGGRPPSPPSTECLPPSPTRDASRTKRNTL